MKLLFDENLSTKLIRLVSAQYPGSTHVREVDLKGATDYRIWEYAQGNGFTIVSKDDDFRQRSLVEGAPPKVIWLQVGNAGTSEIAALFQSKSAEITAFDQEDEAAILIISNVARPR